MQTGVPQIVGREEELAALRAFVEDDGRARALVLQGGAGIGKTTLWEAGIAAAAARGLRVLSARPSGAEAQLSFGALIDLLDGVEGDELTCLPPPQRRALDVALLRANPRGALPEPQAIGVGLLNVLRALAARGRVLVAVDDIQWLDAPSAEALSFAARRIDGSASFLLARRPGDLTVLERALTPRGVESLQVGALSLGAIRRLLFEQLGLHLRRQLLRRIADGTLGNPLFALELGRALAERGGPDDGEELPVPELVEDLLGTRIAGLPPQVRRLLLAVALSADLRASQLALIGDTAAIDAAVDADLLVFDGERVRASHPLLAAAAKQRARPPERRALHLELAGVANDATLRARHLALASDGSDDDLAATLAAAAAAASARGLRQEAVELAGHALRLTPPDSASRNGRVLALGGYLDKAGEATRLTELLTPELDSLSPGAERARAWLLLSEGDGVRSLGDLMRHVELALAESRDEPGLRAEALAKKSIHTSASAVRSIPEAEAWGKEALPAARRGGPDVERLVLNALAWARSLGGRPIDDLCARFLEVSDSAVYIAESPERVAGQRLAWRGEIAEARTTLTRALRLADERGEPVSYALQRLHLCELELRAGEWPAASRLLDEWDESSDRELLVPPMYERCRALLAAGRGLPGEVEEWGAKALAEAEATGSRWDQLETLRALGIAAWLEHEPGRTVELLRTVWEHTLQEGIDEPGVFPVAPDLVEALVELGEAEPAQAVTSRLAELAVRQAHPWGLATARRCQALVRLSADPRDTEAGVMLADAAAEYARLGLRLDHARTLLSLGRLQRRARKWGEARRLLERAAAACDELGSVGWAEQARSELTRVASRKPQARGELTPAERRVVDLAAQGLSNKEIARRLFVTINTVEVHLSHAYAKLGVRSRGQLAARLRDADRDG